MNILFFFSTTCIGGAETNFLKIGSEMKKIGHNITVIAIKQDGDLLTLFKNIANYTEVVGTIGHPIRLLSRLHFVIKKFEIETVFNFGLKVEIISRIFSKLFGANYIISNIRSTDDWRRWYHNLLDKCTSSKVDLWVSNSLAGKNVALQRKTANDTRLVVIYNYIDDILINSIQKQDINNKLVKIGILSNIKIGKGFEDLIKLAKVFNQNQVNFQFIIGGQDKMEGSFHTIVEKNNLNDRFIFLGYIENKRSFFENIDICLLPTYWEGFPTSLLEASCYGIPIVTTNVGGIPELIENGINGFMVQPGDILGFYNAITALINDKHLVTKFRDAGFIKLKNNYAKSVVLKKWSDLLNTLKT